MHFTIRHDTLYRYSRPVSLGPHTLRFQPRSDGGQVLKSFDLVVAPQPAVLTHALDAEGNAVAYAWFSGQHQRVSVTSRAVVETMRTNPFDYLLDAAAASLPPAYAPALRQRLAPTLERTSQTSRAGHGKASGDEVREFAAGLNAGGVVPFLDYLCRELQTTCEVVRREEGPPLAPLETLRSRRGACRDLAVLFIDACRAMGLSARFVSGYQEHDDDALHRDMHAWAEVFIPGGGWRGYDPTQDNVNYNTDDIGNRVYMLDVFTGDLLWSTADVSMGNSVRMEHSIPADVRVIDMDNNGLADRMYVADMGARIWRFPIGGAPGLLRIGAAARISSPPFWRRSNVVLSAPPAVRTASRSAYARENPDGSDGDATLTTGTTVGGDPRCTMR